MFGGDFFGNIFTGIIKDKVAGGLKSAFGGDEPQGGGGDGYTPNFTGLKMPLQTDSPIGTPAQIEMANIIATKGFWDDTLFLNENSYTKITTTTTT